MTVGKLIKILKQCNPRSPVTVFLPSFKHPLEEANCLTVDSAKEEFLDQVDGDGFIDYRKDGLVKQKRTVILRGDHEVNEGITP